MKNNQIGNKNYDKFLGNNLNKFYCICNKTMVLLFLNIYKVCYFISSNLFILALQNYLILTFIYNNKIYIYSINNILFYFF